MSEPTASSVPPGWRQGPVAITGASGQVGTALQRRLAAAFPNQVRPLGRGDDLATAFADAEVVIHLAGTLQPREPNSYTAANLGTVQATVAALAGSRVQQVVFLSFPTADPRSPNPYLRAKAAAEAALRDSGIPVTILRCHHIYGPPEEPGPMATSFLARNRRSVTILGRGSQRLSPVYREDVVEAIVHVALDPAASVETFELAGPQTMTAAQFARKLNPAQVRVRPMPAVLARLLGRLVPSLPAALVEVMLSDLAPSAAAAATPGRFGIQLRRVDEVWRPPVAIGSQPAPGEQRRGRCNYCDRLARPGRRRPVRRLRRHDRRGFGLAIEVITGLASRQPPADPPARPAWTARTAGDHDGHGDAGGQPHRSSRSTAGRHLTRPSPIT